MMAIRKFTKSDLEACTELLITVYNREPWNEKWTKMTAGNHLTELIHRMRSFGYVFVDKTTIVGVLFGVERTFWSGEEVYVDEFFIHPSYQQKGIGKEMMRHLEVYCKENDLEDITLLTDKMVPAHVFYQKLGFKMSNKTVFMYKSC